MNGRTCTGCGEWLAWENFHKNAGGANGRASRCRACKTAAKYDWIARNPERHAAYVAEYRAAGQFAEAAQRHYYRNPEKSRARATAWRQRHLDEVRPREREYARKRRYLKISSGVFPDSEWNRLLNRFGRLCAYCRINAAEHREHVIPVSRGGLNTVGNILPSCASCNYSKHVLTLMEWRLSGRAPEAMRPITRSKKNG